MVRELHATLLLIRHVAVGTRHTALGMDTVLGHLPTRMLSLQNLGLRQRMDIVVEANGVVIFLSSLAGQTLVVREYEIVSLAGILLIVRLDEVVLHVALSTHQRAHLLMGGVLDIQSTTGKGLVKGRTGRTQIHRAGIVAVGAADGVYLFGTQFAPLLSIEVSGIKLIFTITKFAHHTRHIRTFTSPTRSRLHINGDRIASVGCFYRNARITRAQNLTHILQGVLVAARGVVVARESIASPQYDHLWTLLEHVHLLR